MSIWHEGPPAATETVVEEADTASRAAVRDENAYHQLAHAVPWRDGTPPDERPTAPVLEHDALTRTAPYRSGPGRCALCGHKLEPEGTLRRLGPVGAFASIAGGVLFGELLHWLLH